MFYKGLFLRLSVDRHTPFWQPPQTNKKIKQKGPKLGGKGTPSGGASVLGWAVGPGVRAFPWHPVVGRQACWHPWLHGRGGVGLDVQWGLLAGEEPEHGGRHGLHVNLSTETGS